jgi:hypothetical protein
MRSINELLYTDKDYFTREELALVYNYIDEDARYTMSSYEYCCLLGWWVLGDRDIPISPKEAGFD